VFREFVGAAVAHAGEEPADGAELESAEESASDSDVGLRRTS